MSRASSNQQAERGGDIAFEILVGLQVLIDEPILKRMFVQRNDPAGGAAAGRRVPRRSSTDEHDQIRRFEMLVTAHAEPERMVVREVRAARARAPDHRDRQGFGKCHQRAECGGIDGRVLGEDDRILGLHQFACQLADDVRGRNLLGRLRHLRRRSVLPPIVQQVFHGHIQVHRPLRSPNGHFARADHTAVERDRALNATGPFDERCDKLVGAADADARIPLRLHRQGRVLAERHRFSREDDDGDFGPHRRVQTQRPLQHSGRRVQQHRLHAPGHHRVSARDIHREGFVPALDEFRARKLVVRLPAQRLPHRRPLGAGR